MSKIWLFCWEDTFLPSCSLGTRGKVWCGHFLKFVQSSPSKNPRKLFPLPCECSIGKEKTSPVWWAGQTLCLILCIEAVNCLSIKSDWWVLKRWCLLTTIFIETKACISYFFVKTRASLVLKYTKYWVHYLNSQSFYSCLKGLEVTQKLKKCQMRKTLIWGMQEKTKESLSNSSD